MTIWRVNIESVKTDEIIVNEKRVVELKHIADEFCKYF